MSAAGAMDEEFSGGRIAGKFQKHRSRFFGRISLIGHRNMDVLHSE